MTAAPAHVSATVRSIVADLAPQPRPVRPALHLVEDLGYDSVSLVDLMTAVEARFGLAPVTGDRILEISTVGDVEQLVASLLTAR